MTKRLLIVLALALLGTAGCGTAGQTEGDRPAPATGARRSDRLSGEEIQALRSAGVSDALTLLQRARPLWIRSRPHDRSGTPVYPMVFYNQQRLGEIAVLRGIRAEHVFHMEYLSPARAMARYGNDGQYGVIVVTGR